ncbi:MAG: hypothetical protein V4754_00210 [Pseudomonadota bacterium]
MPSCVRSTPALHFDAFKFAPDTDTAPRRASTGAATPRQAAPDQPTAHPHGCAKFLLTAQRNEYKNAAPQTGDTGGAAPQTGDTGGAAPVTQRPDSDPQLAKDRSGMLDLRAVETVAGSLGAVASSHAALLVKQGDAVYRLKFNHHGAAATFHEVLAARINQAVFPHTEAPEVKFGTHTGELGSMTTNAGNYTKVGIASKMVKGFQDWGDFLVNEQHGGCAALAHVAPEHQAAYQDLLKQYRTIQTRIARFRGDDTHSSEVRGLLDKPKQPYLTVPADAVAQLEPLRRMARQGLHLQDRMLALLPPPFHHALVQVLYESEALGNWDYANHERANVGFIVRDGELKGATAVDFGVCGETGFSGKPKESSARSAVTPARVDDPFLASSPGNKRSHHYLPGAVLDRGRATDFTQVSPTAGLVGSLPRSASFAAIMKQVIHDEREFGTKPAPMLRTARQLAQVSRQDMRTLVADLCHECRTSDDPEMRALLDQIGQTPERIADNYFERFSAIVQRAGVTAAAPAQSHTV